MLRPPPAARRAQTVAYLLFAGAGATAAVWPSPSVKSTTGSHALLAVWVVFLLAGGVTSGVGRSAGRWVGEFVGIPLLGAAFAIYSVSAVYFTISTGQYTGITAGLALGAIFWLLAARWSEVNLIRLEAVKRSRAERHVQGELIREHYGEEP